MRPALAGSLRVAGVLVLVAAALGAAAWVDRGRPAPAEAELGTVEVPPMPVIETGPTLATSWFCPGVPAATDAPTGTVTVLNTGEEPLEGQVVLVPSEGEPATVPVTLQPLERVTLRPADTVAAPFVAALVEVYGSGAVVEQTSRSSRGITVSPCASSASDNWYGAEGATTTDATLNLLLFNPFPEEAIVDVTFATEEGPRTPQRLQGFVVPGRSLRIVDVDDVVRRNAQVASHVLAKSGRIVAGRFQTYNASPRQGLVAGLLAPATAEQWWFPNGRKAEQLNERVLVSNPGEDDAEVDVVVFPTDPAGEPLEPISVTVPGGAATVVDLTANELVPEGRHAILVSSSVGVVAEQVLELTGNRTTTTSMLGVPVSASRWWVPVTGGEPGSLPILTIGNPTGADETVTVFTVSGTELVPLEGFADVPVPAAGALRVELAGTAGEGGPLLVEGSGPIAVERFLIPVPDDPGAWATVAVPERAR